ncbi:hypothetical protein [Nonomuraea sp. NPDC023979]|uniref:hypothetical protein n=1 Tax=Nonomuraea sp. NPDC023979 TaxID=3154796 RepID=UPI0033EB122A
MLDADPRPSDNGDRLVTFTDGTWMQVDPTSRPFDVVPLFDYEFQAYSPGQLGAPSHRDRPTPIVCWAHADDVDEKAARLHADGYTDIRWWLRAVCEETYRVCYGNRPPQGRRADG